MVGLLKPSPTPLTEALPRHPAETGAFLGCPMRQIRSTARKPKEQEATLRGLGLGKIRRTRTLEDTPSVRGMIRAVQHLVEVVEEKK